jgi:hypothetical protein
MSYDYDFNTILKSALLKNNCSNKSIDAFNNDCMYAPFTNINNDCKTESMMFKNNGIGDCKTESMMFKNNGIGDCKTESMMFKNNGIGECTTESMMFKNDDINYNYDSLIDDYEALGKVGGEGGGVGGVGEVDSSNFFMQGSMKDNYKIFDNNFKEIAEKILLDINCNEDILNKEVVNYEQKNNSDVITKIVHMYNDINKKINALRIEVNAINTLESNLQTIINNLEIKDKTTNSMENKFKNNMNNVIYYNTYFKFIVYLKQQKNILEDNIDTEQLNLNAIMYLVMRGKWFEIAPNVYKLFNQHLPH